jgi:hypothetical protein
MSTLATLLADSGRMSTAVKDAHLRLVSVGQRRLQRPRSRQVPPPLEPSRPGESESSGPLARSESSPNQPAAAAGSFASPTEQPSVDTGPVRVKRGGGRCCGAASSASSPTARQPPGPSTPPAPPPGARPPTRA